MIPFTGCKIFCATMGREREVLGERITTWLEEARTHRPGFQLVEVLVRQSSDSDFHCVTIVLLFNEEASRG